MSVERITFGKKPVTLWPSRLTREQEMQAIDEAIKANKLHRIEVDYESAFYSVERAKEVCEENGHAVYWSHGAWHIKGVRKPLSEDDFIRVARFLQAGFKIDPKGKLS